MDAPRVRASQKPIFRDHWRLSNDPFVELQVTRIREASAWRKIQRIDYGSGPSDDGSGSLAWL